MANTDHLAYDAATGRLCCHPDGEHAGALMRGCCVDEAITVCFIQWKAVFSCSTGTFAAAAVENSIPVDLGAYQYSFGFSEDGSLHGDGLREGDVSPPLGDPNYLAVYAHDYHDSNDNPSGSGTSTPVDEIMFYIDKTTGAVSGTTGPWALYKDTAHDDECLTEWPYHAFVVLVPDAGGAAPCDDLTDDGEDQLSPEPQRDPDLGSDALPLDFADKIGICPCADCAPRLRITVEWSDPDVKNGPYYETVGYTLDPATVVEGDASDGYVEVFGAKFANGQTISVCGRYNRDKLDTCNIRLLTDLGGGWERWGCGTHQYFTWECDDLQLQRTKNLNVASYRQDGVAQSWMSWATSKVDWSFAIESARRTFYSTWRGWDNGDGAWPGGAPDMTAGWDHTKSTGISIPFTPDTPPWGGGDIGWDNEGSITDHRGLKVSFAPEGSWD